MNFGDIPQMNGFAVTPFENEIAQIGDGIAPAERKPPLPAADIHRASGDVFGIGDEIGHFGKLDTELGGAERIENDLQFFAGAQIGDVRATHARNRLQPWYDDIAQKALVTVDIVRIAGQFLHKDEEQRRIGVSAVGELHEWLLRVEWQGGNAIEPADDVDERRLHVSAEREGEVDVAAALAGIALHLLKARNALQDFFFRLNDLGFDLARSFGPPVGFDADLRAIDIREQLDGKRAQREDSEDDRDRDAHRNRCRTLYPRRSKRPHRFLRFRVGRIQCDKAYV